VQPIAAVEVAARLYLDHVPRPKINRPNWAVWTNLGARVLEGQPPSVGRVILADPERNEFCQVGLTATGLTPHH
jgi:hypothetical protein